MDVMWEFEERDARLGVIQKSFRITRKLRALHTEEAFNGLFDQHCFQSAFRRDSSSVSETDESRLVQDEDCMVNSVGAPKLEL
ncbi:hypothetical protein TNCV_1819931 [Trichonephila clavipes]|nr:hypothetical protein TNCV_1819931 [Trichonephila clavipes]